MRRSTAAILLAIAATGCTMPSPSSGTPGSSPSELGGGGAPSQPAASGLELIAVAAEGLVLEPLIVVDGTEPAGSLTVGTPFVVVQRTDDALLVLPPGGSGVSAAWIPTETEAGAPAVVPLEAPCPIGDSDLEQLILLGALASFCDRVVAFEGYVPEFCGAASGGPLVTGTPDWIYGFAPWLWVYAELPDPLTQAEPPPSGVLVARTPPTVPIANCDPDRAGRWYTFSGHFDDRASASCRATWSDRAGPLAEPPAVGEAACRMTLVIDAARPIPAP